jgi:hypothetical protein
MSTKSTKSTPEPAAAAPAKPRTRTRSLPQGQLELATLALHAARFWQTAVLGDLLWQTKAGFLALAEAYAASLSEAEVTDDARSPQAQRLRVLDQRIDKALGFVKAYLAEDHDEDEGEGYYEEFGVRAEGKNLRLPAARPARARALGKLLRALDAHGYTTRKFGRAYWEPIAAEYRALVLLRGQTEGRASAAVGRKNAQEKPLRKVLRALMSLIKAHYPDTQASVLRQYGFQKEVY